MPSQTYRLKLVRAGHEFEAEGDKRFVLEMLKRFAPDPSGALPVAEGSPPVPPGQPALASKNLSVREFIQGLGLKKHTDLTLAFGYYLEKFQGAASFTPADINACYYEAKMEASNTSQMLIQNIKRGLVMEPKSTEKSGRKRYTLTSTGENYVKAKLDAPAE